jgi:hypothetical protein
METPWNGKIKQSYDPNSALINRPGRGVRQTDHEKRESSSHISCLRSIPSPCSSFARRRLQTDASKVSISNPQSGGRFR